MGPLSGITVVSLEQAIAAPFCTRQLADLGARVIKVERPGGGDFARRYDTTVKGLSSHFVWTNRGKESLTLDVKSGAGKEVLDRLLGQADVLVENLAPGAAHRLGVAGREFTDRFPELVVCHVSGYGEGGPLGTKKAYDLLVQAEAGLLSVTGTDAGPAKVGISIADIAAGMYAFTGVLGAVYARRDTGRGTELSVSLLDALSEWMSYALYYAAYGGAAPRRTGASHATIFPYGPFPAGDGGEIFLAVQNDREWVRFSHDVLGRADLAAADRFATNASRVRHREALEAAIREAFASLTTSGVADRLEAAGIAWARMNDVGALFTHPQLRARERFGTVRTEAGEIEMLKPPVIGEGFDEAVRRVPALGEDTDRILAELGYAAPAIQRLHEDGTV